MAQHQYPINFPLTYYINELPLRDHKLYKPTCTNNQLSLSDLQSQMVILTFLNDDQIASPPLFKQSPQPMEPQSPYSTSS